MSHTVEALIVLFVMVFGLIARILVHYSNLKQEDGFVKGVAITLLAVSVVAFACSNYMWSTISGDMGIAFYILGSLLISTLSKRKVRDQISKNMRSIWKVEIPYNFEGRLKYCQIGECYKSERLASEAAAEKLRELKKNQQTSVSGGQSSIQNEVFVVSPSGYRRRVMLAKRY